jgi:integrase
MKKNQFNFTQAAIEKLPIPENGRAHYYDIKVPELELRITQNGIKTFNYYKWRKGHKKPDRIYIGNYPALSIEWVRERARIIGGDIARGLHPKEQERYKITLIEFFPIYMERWNKKHKKAERDDRSSFDGRIKNSFIAKKPLGQINRQDILKLHSEIGQTAPIRANRILSLLSIIFNKAIEWEYIKENPCKNIKRFKEKSRERFLLKDEIPNFFKALDFLKPKYKTYFLVLLFTGARSANVKAMRWQDINFAHKTWSLSETKNGTSQLIPLSDAVLEMLKERKGDDKIWVFPSDTSTSGHLEEAKKHWSLLRKISKLPDLRMHDLRRTLGSWQAINGVSLAVIGKSLNHKSMQATQIYARLSIDPIRAAMHSAQQAIMNHSVASGPLNDCLYSILTNNHNINLKYQSLRLLTFLLSPPGYGQKHQLKSIK